MVHFVRRRRPVERRHSARKLTYADYVRFPDDNLRHEIIGGEHYVTPSPATRHQRISLRLAYLVQDYLEDHPRGELLTAPVDALLSEFDIVVPDLVYISNERAHIVTVKNLQGAPDLVVEILSPGTRRRDLGIKRSLYERVGVAEYWLVDPARNEVTVHRRGEAGFDPPVCLSRSSGDVLTTELMPGLQIPLPKLLA
jgi:Uma2 family endonuclease